ncbi:ParB N-terminal domain-containing protein [Pelagibacterium sediminicola]|uniref:ParB N-terminal domain-containing protein n=1 Tax=Pelagibacterium sediminicola TaxID=2248761 RepID=UPI000E3176ED|nr:ParB N-terminal domain-containing protein [Pelagibacterium sediminicola]
MLMKTVRLKFDSVADGLAHIRKALEENPGQPAVPAKGMPLREIMVCETVFQRRDTFGNRRGREEHIRDLKRAIQDSPGTMEPLDIWWGGDGWYMLDGHHRVLAYESLRFTGNVPVRVITGTLDEALEHVGRVNTRGKLPMTLEERNSLAVFYVCQFPGKSLREIAAMGGVGKSNVGKMKKAVSKVIDLGHTREELLGLSWYEIQQMARGETESDYDYEGEMRKLTNEIKQAIGPILGHKPHMKAEAVTMALQEISPALYRGILDLGNPVDDFEEDPIDAEY